MGSTVNKCARSFFLGDDETKKRELYELSIDGVPGLVLDKYKIQERIYEGRHGEVYFLTESGSGRKLVMKVRDKNQKSFRFMDIHRHALAIADLKSCKLRHEHLCTYFGFYESKNMFCAVQERCEGVSLAVHLETRTFIEDVSASKYFMQMVHVVSYLHGKDIIHRDLRLERFLFSGTGNVKIKLNDLTQASTPAPGMGKLRDPAKPVIFLFASPETLSDSEFSTMTDVWSLGCCLFEMLYGHPPFTGANMPLCQRIVNDKINFHPLFSGVSNKGSMLAAKLLVKDPFGRASLHNVLDDVWFKDAESITAKKRTEAMHRMAKYTEMFEDTDDVFMGTRAGGVEGEQGKSELRSEYSRSLTDTYSNLSISTRSSRMSEPEDAFVGEDEADSGSEDFQLHISRSDQKSLGVPNSACGSHSDTYVNSDAEPRARQRGYFDEFDSLNFEDDMKASSLWSEAEYSDWSIDDKEKAAYDKEWKAHHYAMDRALAKAIFTKKKKEKANWEEKHSSDTWSKSDSKSKSHTGSDWSGGESRSEDSQWSGSPKGQKPAGGGGGTGGGTQRLTGSQASEEAESEVRETEEAETEDDDSWGAGSASDALEQSARSRGDDEEGLEKRDFTGLYPSTVSDNSAPWEYDSAEKTGSSSSGSSSRRSAGSRHSGGKKGAVAGTGGLSQLAPIREDGPENIGDVTKRALAAAAPWDDVQAAAGRALPGAGMIVLSRRSNESSGSSQRSRRSG